MSGCRKAGLVIVMEIPAGPCLAVGVDFFQSQIACGIHKRLARAMCFSRWMLGAVVLDSPVDQPCDSGLTLVECPRAVARRDNSGGNHAHLGSNAIAMLTTPRACR
jgi:hypothetical protein